MLGIVNVEHEDLEQATSGLVESLKAMSSVIRSDVTALRKDMDSGGRSFSLEHRREKVLRDVAAVRNIRVCWHPPYVVVPSAVHRSFPRKCSREKASNMAHAFLANISIKVGLRLCNRQVSHQSLSARVQDIRRSDAEVKATCQRLDERDSLKGTIQTLQKCQNADEKHMEELLLHLADLGVDTSQLPVPSSWRQLPDSHGNEPECCSPSVSDQLEHLFWEQAMNELDAWKHHHSA